MKKLKWIIGAYDAPQLIMVDERGKITRYAPVRKGNTLECAIRFLSEDGNIPILKQLFSGKIIYEDT